MADQQVTTTRGATLATAVLKESAIQDFKAGLSGALLRPAEAGYDDARKIWNGMIDKRPALIARCRGVADVISSVRFARTHDLLLAVRGGGHNLAGNAVCDGGLMIDLSLMKGVRVDPALRMASAPDRAYLGRARPRDPSLRPGRHRGTDLHHRYRRPYARRRMGLPGAPARPRLRQPSLSRSRHGRRRISNRQRRRACGPLLGHAGWRWEFWSRHLI
jgi:hypothetical protein